MLWKHCVLFAYFATVAKAIPLRGKGIIHSKYFTHESHRLPRSIIPEKYSIKLITKLESDFVFYGEVTIRVKVIQQTDNITLHVNDIDIDKASVTVTSAATGMRVDIVDQSKDEEKYFYILSLAHELEEGEEYSVYIKYKGYHRDDLDGFYRSSYVNDRGEKVWLVATQFQPSSARRAFPCFDEPGLKAKFQISIARPAHLHAVSNMPLKKTEYSHELDLFLDTFEETPMAMSTYLVAFVVSDFEATRDGHVSVLHQPGLAAEAMFSTKLSTSALNYFRNFTGIPYSMPKLDEVAAPEFAGGAMENWGLCIYKDKYLLFEKNVSTSSSMQEVGILIFHELAHQWFGNLVTPKWWKYLWLSEGFATYFEYMGTSALYPEWRFDEQFVVQKVHVGLLVDQFVSRHPMTVEVNTKQEVENIFDGISYHKAGSVIRMWEHILSHHTFKNGLRRFLMRSAYGTVKDSDLFDAFEFQYKQDHPHSPLDVKSIFKSWTDKEGYPLITITRDYDKGTATIRQSCFLSRSPVEDNYKWWIPLNYATMSNPNFEETNVKEWLKSKERKKTFNLGLPPDDWIIFNIQETGFYRVNYDSRNWALIMNYLKSTNFTNIHPVNRAKLLNDAFIFVTAHLLSFETLLDLTSYLFQETDYIPWFTAYGIFEPFMTQLKGSQYYAAVQDYMLELLDTVYNTLGFQERQSDDHVTKLNRNLILQMACRISHEDCLSNALQKFNKFVKDPANLRVEPDLKSVVYCYGLIQTGQEEWDLIWNIFLNSKIPSDKQLLSKVLGCVGNEDVAHKFLNYMSNRTAEEIKAENLRSILESLVSNGNGTDYVISYIIKYYQSIMSLHGPNKVIKLLHTVSSHISSSSQYDKLNAFIDGKEDELNMDTELMLRVAQHNLDLQEEYGSTIFNWLQERNSVKS